MKKLFLSLLTLAATATAAAGLASCSSGQTGGGDNTATRNMPDTQIQTPELQDRQAAGDGEFEFMPPQLPMGIDDLMPIPPQGRIFNQMGRLPEFLHMPQAGGSVKEGSPTGEPMPQGKVNHKNDKLKKDMLTPDGNILPDTQDVNIKPRHEKEVPETENCPDGSCKSQTEENTSESPKNSKEKNGKNKKNKRNRKQNVTNAN